MTIFQTIKRFFEPILREPGYFWRVITINVIYSSYTILSVLFIREIIHIIEIKNLAIITQYILGYGIFNVIYFTLVYFLRHWGWTETIHHLLKMIHRDYMKRFDVLDNTYTENIGTGKIISIVGKGSEVWMNLIIDSLSILVRLIITII